MSRVPSNTTITLFGEIYDNTVDPPELVDPTDVILTIQLPDDSFETFTFSGLDLTNTAVGKYQMDYLPATPGSYEYEFKATGTYTASRRRDFYVLESLS